MAVLHTPLHLWFSAKRRHKPNALLMHTYMLLETRRKENHCGQHYCEACVHQEGEHDLWNFVAPENGSVYVCLPPVDRLWASNALVQYLGNYLNKILSSSRHHSD